MSPASPSEKWRYKKCRCFSKASQLLCNYHLNTSSISMLYVMQSSQSGHFYLYQWPKIPRKWQLMNFRVILPTLCSATTSQTADLLEIKAFCKAHTKVRTPALVSAFEQPQKTWGPACSLETYIPFYNFCEHRADFQSNNHFSNYKWNETQEILIQLNVNDNTQWCNTSVNYFSKNILLVFSLHFLTLSPWFQCTRAVIWQIRTCVLEILWEISIVT